VSGPLGIDADKLASCVQCGLCLPHCPTWRATGEEARSPRGRIDAMRDVESGAARIDGGFVESIDSCVGCLGCETACPSGVEYGELLAPVAQTLAEMRGPGRVPWWQRAALSRLDRPRLLRLAVVAAAVGQRLRLPIAALTHMAPLPLRQSRLAGTGSDVVLLTGCVMDASQRRVHAAVVEVLASAGLGVALQPTAGCCGALAAHRGLHELSDRQLEALAGSLPPEVPVLSDSAGCTAAILEAARHEDAPGAVRSLGERIVDVNEFLWRHRDALPPPPVSAAPVVALQVPCHMRNVAGPPTVEAMESLLDRYADVRRVADDDICCGAGGSHSVLRPAEAAVMGESKAQAVRATGAALVAAANPGCAMHLQACGLTVAHPVEIIAQRIAGGRHEART